MTRSFLSTPLDSSAINRCIEAGIRAPSAGKSHGWHLVVWEGADTTHYWDIAFPSHKRDGFSFPGLFNAPFVALVLADQGKYVARYAETDKASTGWGASPDKWVAPYWTIDASFSTMSFLLAAHNEGLGALFFAHAHEEELRLFCGIPEDVQILGTIACGYVDTSMSSIGRSAQRPWPTVDDVIHRGHW